MPLVNKSHVQPLVKVEFDLGKDHWLGYETETVWADNLPGNRCRIRNSPIYIKGVSFGDIVFARKHGQKLKFRGVSIRSGHSTCRTIAENPLNDVSFLKFWNPIESLGCTFENTAIGKRVLLAVDVPPEADIFRTYELLSEGENNGAWIIEERHCGHAV